MLQETDAFQTGVLRSPFRGVAIAPTPTGLPAPSQPARITADVETVEQEINRLTWSVLDGSAALADRQRLAELVNAQHARRRRV